MRNRLLFAPMALPERTTGGPTIWSVGYAADEALGFLRRLAAHGIVQIADIRTNAWSRYQTDFRRGTIERLFSDAGVAYRFFGEGLGGKPDDEERLTDGRPDDGKILDDPRFEAELTALIQWAQEAPTAFMCGCGWPQGCHRGRLLTPALEARGLLVRHITPDGRVADSLAGAELLRTGQASLFD